MRRFFEALTGLVIDGIGLVYTVARYPGFWHRIRAWMPAGLIVRIAAAHGAAPNVGKIRGMLYVARGAAGMLRRQAECQAEPLALGHMCAAGALRREMPFRLFRLKERYAGAGRGLPWAAEIEFKHFQVRRDLSIRVSADPVRRSCTVASEDRLPMVLPTLLRRFGP